MKHLELFSGIGGFHLAIDLVGKDLHFPTICIGYSEIDKKAQITYNSNFDTSTEIVIGDIVEFTSNIENIDSLPDFDILTGGFPCQTFSMMGAQTGFNEERGQMFFRIMDIVNVKHPRYILLENVKNFVRHDKGKTLQRIVKELSEAGYIVHYDVFNTCDYGLPQTRNRVIIFARRIEDGEFCFKAELVKQNFNRMSKRKCSLQCFKTTLEILAKEVDEKFYLSEKIKPTILSDGSANFKSKSEIDLLIARPLTASMHKMHRACQDNYFSDLFIRSNGDLRPSSWMDKVELAGQRIRKITPQEAFLLQGFPSIFADKAISNGVSCAALYKQAGNAVSVNTIYSILHYLITTKIITL